MRSTNRFYNSISFFYPAINYFLKEHRKVLIDAVNSCPAGRVLEIGIGDGSHLPLYHAHQITGIDISEAMLAKAQRFQGDNAKLFIMNGEDLKFDSASFDYVVISHVLAVAGNPDQLLSEVHRVLKAEGKLFILNHFTPDNWLKYIDMAFHPLSSLFYFKSLFYMQDISGLRRFSLLKQKELGTYSYFKLLILVKP